MKISEICSYGPKSTIKASEAKEFGKYQFFSSSQDENKRCDEYIYDGPSIIIGTGGNASLHYYNGKFSTSTDCLVLIPNDKITSKYLYYYLVGNIRVIEAGFKGIGLKHISKRYINEIRINAVPDINTQKNIIKIFDIIQGIIDIRQKQLRELDELIKARFVEMFGDPIRNSKKRPTISLIDVVTMQRGFDLPVQNRNQNGNVPIFGSNGKLGYHDKAKISGGGVITGRSGTIGKVYYTRDDYWPLNTSLFSADTHGNNIVYLAYLLQMYDLNRFVEGTGVPTLNRNKFHNQQIIDVPKSEQNIFCSFAEKVDKSKFAIQKSLKKTQMLYDSLMQEYFG